MKIASKKAVACSDNSSGQMVGVLVHGTEGKLILL